VEKTQPALLSEQPDADLEIQAGANRPAQLVDGRGGNRGKFTVDKQQTFLELFAATCNAKWSARAAGVAYSTVYRHRMHKPAFADGWDRALEQGYARLEMRALQQQFGNVDEELEQIELTGDWDVPDPPVEDPDRALQMLKHYHDRVSKIRAARTAREPGELKRERKPAFREPIADDAEIVAALSERLARFGAEVMAETPLLPAPEQQP